MEDTDPMVISLQERREFIQRRNQRSKALFCALLMLSIILYCIALIH